MPGTLFSDVVLKRFTVGKHEQHFELPKQHFFGILVYFRFNDSEAVE